MTTNKDFRFWVGADNDGTLDWENAKTISRYRALGAMHPDYDNLGCFYAFGNDSYKEGVKRLLAKGIIKKESELMAGKYGLVGTQQGLNAVRLFYDDVNRMMAEECDPQEVYCYEYNNFECCIAYDGDRDAIMTVLAIFGYDAASRIMRVNAFCDISRYGKEVRHEQA